MLARLFTGRGGPKEGHAGAIWTPVLEQASGRLNDESFELGLAVPHVLLDPGDVFERAARAVPDDVLIGLQADCKQLISLRIHVDQHGQ